MAPGSEENTSCGPVKSSCVTPGKRAKTITGWRWLMVRILCIIDARTVAGIGSVLNDLFPSFTAMPRNIAVLIFPDFQLLDAAGPITAFEEARRATTARAYRLRLIAQSPGRLSARRACS